MRWIGRKRDQLHWQTQKQTDIHVSFLRSFAIKKKRGKKTDMNQKMQIKQSLIRVTNTLKETSHPQKKSSCNKNAQYEKKGINSTGDAWIKRTENIIFQ